MSDKVHGELLTLCERWRSRARTFMAEAERSPRPAEVVRLTAMASTLEWAAGDLSTLVAQMMQRMTILQANETDLRGVTSNE